MLNEGVAVKRLLFLILIITFLPRYSEAAESQKWGKDVKGLRCSISLRLTTLRVGDPFIVDVKIKNVSDKPIHIYYPGISAAKQFTIRNEKGDLLKSRITAMYLYRGLPNMMGERRSVSERFRLLRPRETFSTQISGRVTFEFNRTSVQHIEKSDRLIIIDFRDVSHYIDRPGKFTVNLHLSADTKTEALGTRHSIEPVWSGDLFSNIVTFRVQLMTREELNRTIETLRVGTLEERIKATKIVGANADRQAVPILLDLLNRGPSRIMRPASDALCKIQDTSIISELLTIYQKTGSSGLQRIVLETIQSLNPDAEKTTDLFMEVLKSEASWEAKSYVAYQLAYRKQVKSISALIEAANNGDPRIQRAAIDALGILGSTVPADIKSEITTPLIQIMKSDPDRTVRSRAARVLGQISDISVVPALVDALKDANHWVGAAAATSLGKLGGSKVIPALNNFAKAATHKSQVEAAKKAITAIERRVRIK